jgi:hypothetical protein
MSYEPKINQCFAFAKKADAHPKAPDFKGTIQITEPGVYDIVAWKGEVGKDTKYKGLSIKLTTPYKRGESAAPKSKPNLDAAGNPLPW